MQAVKSSTRRLVAYVFLAVLCWIKLKEYRKNLNITCIPSIDSVMWCVTVVFSSTPLTHQHSHIKVISPFQQLISVFLDDSFHLKQKKFNIL